LKSIFSSAQPYISWFGNVGVPKAVNVLAGLLDGAVNTYNFIKNNWSWIAPIVGGITGALVAYRAVTQSIILVKGALAAAQIAWNIAMTANPIGLIIVGVGALIGAGYLLIKNFDTVKAKGAAAWSYLRDAVRGPANSMIGFANGVIGAFESMINGMGSAVNKIPKVKIPDWVPKYGGMEYGIPGVPTVSLPKIPMLAKGGITTGATLAMIGEGAEQEAVLPLSKLNALLNTPGENRTNNSESSEQTIQVIYSPQYYLPPGANKEDVERVTKQGYNEFKRWIKQYEGEKKRLKFS